MSRVRLLAVASLLAGPLAAAATEAPHNASGGYSCVNCHIGHNAQGTSLTRNSVNSALCDSCHVTGLGFGFPFSSGEQAQAGAAGSSHSWSASASNLQATSPDPASADTVIAAMGKHLDAGKLKCSTCHDVHAADLNPGIQHTSISLATNIAQTAGTGTGTLQLSTVGATAVAAGYVIQLSATNAFRISHDNGLSYFGYSGTTWSAGTATGKTFTSGTAVTLDDPAVSVTFTGTTFAVGDTFKNFYVSYPYLRGEPGRMCVSCHQNRNQTWQNVEGTGSLAGNLGPVLLSTTVLSHPVNQALGANGGGYDPAGAGSILDADGSVQSVGDANKTNDLVLNAAGNVACTTCHHPHNADSNSLTVDPR